MAITTGNFAALMWPGIDSVYQKEYVPKDEEWRRLVDVSMSNQNSEETIGFSGLGLFQTKDEGDPIIYDVMRQGFKEKYLHTVYALGFQVTREMYDDNLYGIIANMARQLAWVGIQTKETIVANMFNDAFDSTVKTFGDGLELCSTAHLNVAGGTWANTPTSGSDVSEASLESDCVSIQALLDDRGNKIKLKANSLHIHPNDQFEVERILKSPYQSGTANNDINALGSTGKFPGGYHVHHFFEDTDAYFIRTNTPTDTGLRYFERDPDEFQPMKDNDFDTDNAKFKARQRFSIGADDKRSVWGNPGG